MGFVDFDPLLRNNKTRSHKDPQALEFRREDDGMSELCNPSAVK